MPHVVDRRRVVRPEPASDGGIARDGEGEGQCEGERTPDREVEPHDAPSVIRECRPRRRRLRQEREGQDESREHEEHEHGFVSGEQQAQRCRIQPPLRREGRGLDLADVHGGDGGDDEQGVIADDDERGDTAQAVERGVAGLGRGATSGWVE